MQNILLLLLTETIFAFIILLLIETDGIIKMSIKEISQILSELKTSAEVEQFLDEILTSSEIETLSKRWRILNLLKDGMSQRDIAKDLGVSLCKITRGSKLLKNKNSITARYLIKEK